MWWSFWGMQPTVMPVSHMAASLPSYSTLTMSAVHENRFLCDSWWASGLFNITFLGQLDQRSRNSSGIRTGIVPSAFSGYCTDLTATPAWVRPLPGSSPIKMCRNAERGKISQSWIHTLRSLPQCGVHTATWVQFIHLTIRLASLSFIVFFFSIKTDRLSYDNITASLKARLYSSYWCKTSRPVLSQRTTVTKTFLKDKSCSNGPSPTRSIHFQVAGKFAKPGFMLKAGLWTCSSEKHPNKKRTPW